MFQLVYDCGKEFCYVNLLNFNSISVETDTTLEYLYQSIIVLKLRHMAMITTFSHALKSCLIQFILNKRLVVFINFLRFYF